jgi:hypothetical protein
MRPTELRYSDVPGFVPGALAGSELFLNRHDSLMAWPDENGGIHTANLGPWKDYTPSVGANSGTLGAYTVTGRYCRIGNTVLVAITLMITNNGNAAVAIQIGLPLASLNDSPIFGRENYSTGKIIAGFVIANGATLSITDANNGYPGGSNYRLVLGGSYEAT